MKKLLTSVVALAMTAGLALSMTACGFTGGSDTGGEKLPEETFAESWAAAFDEKNFENFKIVVTETATGNLVSDSSKNTITATIEAVRADDLEHIKLDADGDIEDVDFFDMEYYFDGEKFYLKNEGGAWNVDSEYSMLTASELLDLLVIDYSDRADACTYDAEKGGYVVEATMHELVFSIQGGSTIPATFIFKFKDGKLVHITQLGKYEEEIEGVVMNIEFNVDIAITYGGQSLELPPEVSDEDEEHTYSDAELAQEAIDVIRNLYMKDGKVKNYETPSDYTVLAQVQVNGTTYAVKWIAEVTTAAYAENVKIGAKDGNNYTIEITRAAVDIEYTLIASVTAGKVKATIGFDHLIPGQE